MMGKLGCWSKLIANLGPRSTVRPSFRPTIHQESKILPGINLVSLLRAGCKRNSSLYFCTPPLHRGLLDTCTKAGGSRGPTLAYILITVFGWEWVKGVGLGRPLHERPSIILIGKPNTQGWARICGFTRRGGWLEISGGSFSWSAQLKGGSFW